MILYLVVLVTVYTVILITDASHKARYKKDLRWMVASMRCGRRAECEAMLRSYPEFAADTQEQIALIEADMCR